MTLPPFVGHVLGDDVDHPARGCRAIERRPRATDDLDPFDGRGGRQVTAALARAPPVVESILRGPDGLAVDQHEDVILAKAANGDVVPTEFAALFDRDTGGVAQKIGDGLDRATLEVFGVDHGDRGGRVGQQLLEPGGGQDQRAEVMRAVVLRKCHTGQGDAGKSKGAGEMRYRTEEGKFLVVHVLSHAFGARASLAKARASFHWIAGENLALVFGGSALISRHRRRAPRVRPEYNRVLSYGLRLESSGWQCRTPNTPKLIGYPGADVS